MVLDEEFFARCLHDFCTDRSTLFVQKTVAKRFKPPVTGLLTARKGAMRRTIPTNK